MFVCVSNLDTYGKSLKVSLHASKLGAEEELSYIAAQVKQFEDDQMMQNVTLKPVDDLLTSLSEYKQTLEQYLKNVTMTSLSQDWKKREIQNLSDIVQARIKYVQVLLTLHSLYSLQVSHLQVLSKVKRIPNRKHSFDNNHHLAVD